MDTSVDRRRFLQLGAASSLAFWVGSERADADPVPEQKLNIGCIGCGGRGAGDIDGVASQNIIALCDVDDRQIGGARQRFPNAKVYRDFRKMLEEVREIEAVTVATPDHTHAAATAMAMRMGKHVYTEKPLTRTVHEARVIRRLQQERPKLATQMGNQGTSSNELRAAVEIIQAGAIGQVREAHVWTDRPIWPQALDRPTDTPAVPQELDWDLWLGPAPARPYHPVYLPFVWRGWWDFGTGALGDMACHNMNMPFMALKLGYPTSVDVQQSDHHPETAPKWSVVTYEFPARGDLPPVKLVWYDGGKLPPAELMMDEPVLNNGTVLVGDQGTLYSPGDSGWRKILLPRKQFEGYQPPAETIPRSPGHHQEWINACKGGPPALSNFNYAAFLTEVVVLGCVALRLNQKIEWDAENARIPGCPDADALLRPAYRKGWTV